MEEKIYFKTASGIKLCGILSDPGNTKTVMVLCHGFTTSKDNPSFPRLQPELNKNNIAAFRFDFFGHGESEGKFENITISEAVTDALAAIELMKKKGYTKIGLLGSSFGGSAAIMTASKFKDLFALVLRSPVSDYLERDVQTKSKEELEKWKNDGFRLFQSSDGRKSRVNYTFFEDYKNNRGYEAGKKITAPTLIIHGDADVQVPVQQSVKMAGIIKNCKLEILKGADHKYTNPVDFEKMIKIVSEFIVKQASK